ncbi:MAG: hypothetical protein RDU24_06090 [Humidesulfovibrio sp.]|uniref:hypothetical protein n=1 Tax=Humidesulfovibrio sp. TaxID=2910988 RepID=UPI0027F31A90|nr:hypothetical protein [Humidesulfovibrio sp.]MDQ7834934.1 hypothetical protein [Humidesulfovibrio sp.]
MADDDSSAKHTQENACPEPDAGGATRSHTEDQAAAPTQDGDKSDLSHGGTQKNACPEPDAGGATRPHTEDQAAVPTQDGDKSGLSHGGTAGENGTTRRSRPKPCCEDIQESLEALDHTFPDTQFTKDNKNGWAILNRRLFKFWYPNSDPHHDDITKKVFRRLNLRHAVLNQVEHLTKCHDVHRLFWNPKLWEGTPAPPQGGAPASTTATVTATQSGGAGQGGPTELETETTVSASGQGAGGAHHRHSHDFLPADIRAYNLAVTDLFVEKALAYLSRKARGYERSGKFFFGIAMLAVFLAVAVSAKLFISENLTDDWTIPYITTIKAGTNNNHLLYQNVNATLSSIINDSHLKEKVNENNIEPILMRLVGSAVTIAMFELIGKFIKAFTFYGLIVLIAVYCYRMSKALIDQSERIKDRRHALRQGRMFVHLNGGRLSIDEMEKAFNWNSNPDNAFSNINPDAQAPWGTVMKEMMQTLRETTKATAEMAKATKKVD